MKKIFSSHISFLFRIILGGIVLFYSPIWVFAQETLFDNFNSFLPPPTGSYYSTGFSLSTILIDYAGIFKRIVAILAILFIVIAGIRMITASGNEEIVVKNRKAVLWLLIGLVIMNIAEPFVAILFGKGFGYDQFMHIRTIYDFNAYSDDIPEEIRETLMEPLLFYFLSFMAAVAVLMVVLSALKMITAMGDEGKVKKQQQTLIGAVIGLFIILIAKPIVNTFYGYQGQGPTPERGISIITGIANFIMGFTAVAAIVMLIIAGIMMIINFGNDQRVAKAKKIITWVIIGLALILSAYTIVVMFIAPTV